MAQDGVDCTLVEDSEALQLLFEDSLRQEQLANYEKTDEEVPGHK
jgi:hypothetical protein